MGSRGRAGGGVEKGKLGSGGKRVNLDGKGVSGGKEFAEVYSDNGHEQLVGPFEESLLLFPYDKNVRVRLPRGMHNEI